MSRLKIKKRLGEILVESGLVTQEDCENALANQKGSKKKLGELLVENHYCSEDDIAAALSSQLGIPSVDLRSFPIEPRAVKMIPEALARKHLIIPLAIDNKEIHLAIADPFGYEAMEDTKFATGFHINPFISTKTDILAAIDANYHESTSLDSLVSDFSMGGETLEVVEDEDSDGNVDTSDLKKQVEAAPIIRMVNLIITNSVEQKASDIHIEPFRDKLVIRHRVDGALRLDMELPKYVQGAVISRFKIMANLDITERRLPQDGRIAVKVGSKMLDLRVSTLPANYGEKIVIRILDSSKALVSMENLGLTGNTLGKFKTMIAKPQGIILVTGPTGSGKTTTLYAALAQIKDIEKNITTVEDPIEYELEGINQVGINEKAGGTFSMMLRALLRQDPDVIMVGEMRDVETSQIAMQAALTGHLVLSTLHTNNTVATITRLRDLGIASYLISSTIIGIMAQRLVRVVCPFCRIPEPPSPDLLERVRLSPDELNGQNLYRGKGCSQCGNTGFKGRIGIYEMLVMSEPLQRAIAADASEEEIGRVAVSEGMDTLLASSKERLLNGITSVEEVLRVIQT